MLTIDSIIAVTRQQAAFGELPAGPVPRDRGARPRTSVATRPVEDMDPVAARAEYAKLLGVTDRSGAQQARYEELSDLMDRMPHPGMTDEENRRVREATERLDQHLASATPEQIARLSETIGAPDRQAASDPEDDLSRNPC